MEVRRKQLVWLISGTSSGIGRELVLAALARGDKVIATARTSSFHKLEDLREKGAATVELDVTWPLAQIKEAVVKAEEIYGRIDVLFNNAASVLLMAVEETTTLDLKPVMMHRPEGTLHVFNTNVFGGMNLARAVLPGMRARKEGTILWNGSENGWEPAPVSGLYSMSKFCLRGLSQVLHAEISPLGLRSVIVEPGHFRTNLHVVATSSYEKRIEDYTPITETYYQTYKSMVGKQVGDPNRAVEVILDLVRGEGVAQGREVPTTLPLGSDALEVVGNVCKATIGTLEEWRDVISSTDIAK